MKAIAAVGKAIVLVLRRKFSGLREGDRARNRKIEVLSLKSGVRRGKLGALKSEFEDLSLADGVLSLTDGTLSLTDGVFGSNAFETKEMDATRGFSRDDRFVIGGNGTAKERAFASETSD